MRGVLSFLTALGLSSPVAAFDWSQTECDFQSGNLRIPSWAGGGDAEHSVSTVPHASGWQYGDHYVFIDFMDAQNVEFQALDLWGEWDTHLRLGKYIGRELRYGRVKELGLLMGFNRGKKAGIKTSLPGVRLALDCPGFRLANLDFMTVLSSATRPRMKASCRHWWCGSFNREGSP